MAHLTQADVDGALAVVREAAVTGVERPFELPAIDQLGKLVPADHVSYSEYTFDTGALDFVVEAPERALVDGSAETMWETCRDYPLGEVAVGDSATPLLLSDFGTLRQLRSNAFYVGVLRANGFEYELKLFLPAPNGMARTFDFMRGAGRDFDERDRSVLALLRPHLVELRRRWERRSRPAVLTSREREVVQLVAEGHTNSEIAERLVISASTVRTHLEHVYKKLGVHTRTAAVAAAFPLTA